MKYLSLIHSTIIYSFFTVTLNVVEIEHAFAVINKWGAELKLKSMHGPYCVHSLLANNLYVVYHKCLIKY